MEVILYNKYSQMIKKMNTTLTHKMKMLTYIYIYAHKSTIVYLAQNGGPPPFPSTP